MKLRRGVIIALALFGSLATMVTGASAQEAPSSRTPVGAAHSEGSLTDPSIKDAARAPEVLQSRVRTDEENCATAADGVHRACLDVTVPDKADLTTPPTEMSSQAIVAFPEYCSQNPYTGIWATRIGACEVTRLRYYTERIVDGVPTPTGEALMNVYPYAYASTSLPTWGHQIQVSAYQGWGDALNATVQGDATGSGSCVRRSSSFPPRRYSRSTPSKTASPPSTRPRPPPAPWAVASPRGT
ncbi:hypothetical protein C8E97_4281 [Saccharothrix australiensis]|uniref:Secreted protein n=1 Tax=Saccharothrix australiensis TaxID=2072 RepID=A0A495W1N6_9PSEU|nr:hypothetical protein C8E97_4281 [Saccharothrix australiensis]